MVCMEHLQHNVWSRNNDKHPHMRWHMWYYVCWVIEPNASLLCWYVSVYKRLLTFL